MPISSIGSLVPESFFFRNADQVAPDLLGMILIHDSVAVRITEVESYDWPDDTANHTRMGRTRRNAPMWGTGGRIYLYRCYGIHPMLNLVTNPEGEGAAVLIRSVEAIHGREELERRRGRSDRLYLAGPGKVGVALALNESFNFQPVFEPGGLELHVGNPPTQIVAGPRVGIGYASPEDQAALRRFADGESLSVTHRKQLCHIHRVR